MKMITLDETLFENTVTPVETEKGGLNLLHGRLPHYLCENIFFKFRHAYTLHVIDGNKKNPKEN